MLDGGTGIVRRKKVQRAPAERQNLYGCLGFSLVGFTF